MDLVRAAKLKKITLRNEIPAFVTIRNKMKIPLKFGFAKQAKFRETVNKFRLVSCFAKPK
jgi:hypothetical protein